MISKAARATAYQPSSQTMARSFLEQAEVCREQAREAARLKRFGAALGLFATAASLCRHATTIGTDVSTGFEINDCLRQIELEAATYFELARSLERPMQIVE